MDRNEIYEEIDLSEDRINSVMKDAGYLNICLLYTSDAADD